MTLKPYSPARAKILDKICIVESTWYGSPAAPAGGPFNVVFNGKVDNPPSRTIVIIDNEFAGPFQMSTITDSKNSFYATLSIQNAIPSKANPLLTTDLRGWSINELLMEGVINKNGVLDSSVSLVAVTYNQYSTMILKNGAIYNKILGL